MKNNSFFLIYLINYNRTGVVILGEELKGIFTAVNEISSMVSDGNYKFVCDLIIKIIHSF